MFWQAHTVAAFNRLRPSWLCRIRRDLQSAFKSKHTTITQADSLVRRSIELLFALEEWNRDHKQVLDRLASHLLDELAGGTG